MVSIWAGSSARGPRQANTSGSTITAAPRSAARRTKDSAFAKFSSFEDEAVICTAAARYERISNSPLKGSLTKHFPWVKATCDGDGRQRFETETEKRFLSPFSISHL